MMAQESSPHSDAQKSTLQSLDEIYQQYWDGLLADSPLMASRNGIREADFHLPHCGTEQQAKDLEFHFNLLQGIQSLDLSVLAASARQQAQMLTRILEIHIEGVRIGLQYTPVSQRRGPQVWLPMLASRMSFERTRDHEAYLSRLKQVPRYIDQTLEMLRKGMELGFLPPAVTLEGVIDQITSQVGSDPQQTLFYSPFGSMPSTISEQDRTRLQTLAQAVIGDQVQPAFRKFKDFMETDYIPLARDTFACLYYPTGSDYYGHCIRRHTTTHMNAMEIHKIGQSEVARIRKQMQQVIAEVEFEGDFAAFIEHLRTDSSFYHDDPEELLRGYRDICKRADAMLPLLFGRLPRAPYGVRKIPDFEAPRSTTAYYRPAPPDGSQPGWFYANTHDLKSRPRYEMEALALHEAVPGHHLQLALQNELKNLPRWRTTTHFTAYTEGWGLYSESLGEAMGFYQDPYSRFGQLSYQMWRALRLVVDTGIHHLGWSRQQAIDVMLENSALSIKNIESEIDRYISWPGQALAYKIGELVIQELVQNARSKLGQRFDIRSFHDHLLEEGSMPLDLLRSRMESWIVRNLAAEED
jgi:prolyl oligopeptidase